MTKARDIADFKFENIVDTGTEGTKVASGTTAQRGSTAGQLRFNTDTTTAEYYTGTEFKSIDTPPTVSSVDVTNIATDLGGTETFVITGTFFVNGATVKFRDSGGTLITADTVTFNSSTQLTATKTRSSFSNANEPYDLIVTNPSGFDAILNNSINVDNAPVWSTASGSLATITDSTTGTHATVSAIDSDGDTVAYSETTSVLAGAGLLLNTSTGAITGDPTNVSSSTTYNFTLRATAGSQSSDRNFSITVNPTPIEIAYLVVAGGGASSGNSGGAGAGGLRTSYSGDSISGGGGSVETPLSKSAGTVLTITVGAGGTAPSGDGGDSIINDGTSNVVTTDGGGGGTAGNGRDGGSTSGNGYTAGGSNTATATANEGFKGGGGGYGSSPYYTAGGGGAGAVGGNALGNGGAGVSSSITGSATTYAGGGGGGSENGSAGSGGSGGGGTGSGFNGSPPQAGTNGLGGGAGGGAGGGGSSNQANGGSGVVILRVPTAKYSGTTTGSPTISNHGSDTIIKFTGSGTYTV